MRTVTLRVLVAPIVAAAAFASLAAAPALTSPATPIDHVVVIYQENHTFNDVLGWLCDEGERCDGTEYGVLPDGSPIELAHEPDIVPNVGHGSNAQAHAINAGAMNGFGTIQGCTEDTGWACYARYRAKDIPNLATLAKRYAISDHTFELSTVPSWGGHLELVAGTLDGFLGDNPHPVEGNPAGPGWGCDSYRDARWRPSPDVAWQMVPSCVPAPDGSGPYRSSPVLWVPTIMDRMDDAGRSWRIYADGPNDSRSLPYGWAICPTFAECLNGPQRYNVVDSGDVVADAQDGTLPNLSIVIPTGPNSQHNGTSMLRGDNWIASVVNAVMQGPDWASTAIFITYDDCGCFYDEVPPPAGLGLRVPMVIVSPYARAGFTDTSVASFVSLLAFTEHTFGLQPLATSDATAYDYEGAFDFTQSPHGRVLLEKHPLPRAERRWLRNHPPPDEDT